MSPYAAALRVAEFRALLVGHSLTIASKNMQQLAVASLVYAITRSPLLAAVSFLLGVLPQIFVALTVSSLADRLPARGALTTWTLVRAVAAAVLAFGRLPVGVVLVVLLILGVGGAVEVAVRQALVSDVLGEKHYVTGRALLNIVVGIMQILGFAVGGLVIATIGTSGALWATVGISALAAIVTWGGVKSRSPRGSSGNAFQATWTGNREVFRNGQAVGLLLAHWLPNGMIVGAEALYVPFAGRWAGAFFVAAGAGMLLADAVVGWLPPARRGAWILPLSLLLALPYLLFFFIQPGLFALVVITVASFGFGSTLAIQERLLQVLPEHMRGQGLSLATSGMMTMQAVAAGVTGALAEAFTSGTAMALAGILSLTVTLSLTGHLRARWRPQTHAIHQSVSKKFGQRSTKLPR